MIGQITKLPPLKQEKSIDGDIATKSVTSDKNKALSKVTVNPVSSSSLGTATPQDVLSGKTFSSGSGISVTGTGVKNVHIYGATWAGTSDPSWTRTDEAANFSDPNPYYAGMSGTPSSPFDGLMPWAGIRRVTDSTAGELVEIPKFYYKWTRSGSAMQLQIADGPVEGFYVSPAHADRGDGVGERDYVYVGRYHCASDYLSKTGVLPKGELTRANFRTNIHNLDSNIWQQDYAMFWTIRMLYLVEFANWNSQAIIGVGCGDGTNKESTGKTDTMSYHTGTMLSSKSTTGSGQQYRYIENLWANGFEFVDGIYFSGSNVYCIKNPSQFSDTTNGTLVFTNRIINHNNIISQYNIPSISGYEYALFPNAMVSSSLTSSYVCDEYFTGGQSSGQVLYTGGGYWYADPLSEGLFKTATNWDSTGKYTGVTSRLMVLPSQRLN